MALKSNVQAVSGVAVNDAYCRVVDVSVNKEQVTFTLQYCVDDKKVPFETNRFTALYQLQGANPYAQAYMYLKTLPDFTGAIDC
jgi:hypothetical protein